MSDRVSELRQPQADDGSGGGSTPADARASPGFSRSCRAVPESVAVLRAVVADFAQKVGLAPSTVERVKLAVSEAATNVVVHAYPEAPEPGLIHAEVAFAPGELRVSIADTGSGLDPGRDSPGLGLGLGIIGQVADRFELLQGDDGGLRVLMRFALPARATGS